MSKIEADLRFQTPFGCMVVGPSMSGKSHFILELLRRRADFLNPCPQRVVYAYGIWQSAFDDIKDVEFVKGVEGLSEVQFSHKVPSILVIDDLMEELASNKELSILFTREMHHKNITVFFLVQNLYKQGKSMRDMALNCQIIILFKSMRDTEQIKVLARQTGIKHLPQAYLESIKERYGYLVLNIQPNTPEVLRLQSDILGQRKIYMKK